MSQKQKREYIHFFSHDLTNLDCLHGQVTGKSDTKLYIRAVVPHAPDITVYGFAFWETAKLVALGANATISIIKEFDDTGEFRFRIESIAETSSLVPIRGKQENAYKLVEVA